LQQPAIARHINPVPANQNPFTAGLKRKKIGALAILLTAVEKRIARILPIIFLTKIYLISQAGTLQPGFVCKSKCMDTL
jgi:hypothetical protein